MVTDKNFPFLERNSADNLLFRFPEGAGIMDKNKPYWEVVVGVHTIFKFFGVDYVRRLTYTDPPGVKKNGVRFRFMKRF